MAKAVAVRNTANRKVPPVDVAELCTILDDRAAAAMAQFEGVD